MAPTRQQLLLHVEAICQEEAVRASKRLAKRSRIRLIDVIDEAAGTAESEAMQLSEFEPACEAGCFWCCYQRVTTTPAEILRIVDYLQETLSSTELNQLQQAIVAADQQTRGTTPAERLQARQLCPLLVDGRCMVYYVRPLPCRGYTSSNVAACQQRVENPSVHVSVPGDPVRYLMSLGVLNGLSQGIQSLGLDGEMVELIAALRIALETPEALARWLQGEEIFEQARVKIEPLILNQ